MSLSISTKTERSSKINYKENLTDVINPIDRKNHNLLSLLKQVDATEYISGVSAQNYLDAELFEKNDIKVTWNSYIPKIENGYLSIIHHLLTSGPDNVLEYINQ